MSIRRTHIYAFRKEFTGLMEELRRHFDVVLLPWRSESPVAPREALVAAEPFGLIGYLTWPEFLDDILVEERLLDDGRRFHFVSEHSFCFKAKWSPLLDGGSNATIEYRRYYKDRAKGEQIEKPGSLTRKYETVDRFVKRRLRRAADGVYAF